MNRKFKVIFLAHKNEISLALSWTTRFNTFPLESQQTLVWYRRHLQSESIASQNWEKSWNARGRDLMKFIIVITWSRINVKSFGKDLKARACLWIMRWTTNTFGFSWTSKVTNPFLFSCMEWQPSVQTLTQFFHCSLKSKMFSFTTLKIFSPLVVVCKSLQNKYSLTHFSSFMNQIKASDWALPLMSVDSWTWRDYNRDTSSKCSQIWSFKSEDKSSILREIVLFGKETPIIFSTAFGCSFTAGCFASKCLFNLLGTTASYGRAELQIRQNANGSSSGPKDMKQYPM